MPERRGLWQVSAVVLLGHAAVLTQLSTAPAPMRGQQGVPVTLLYARPIQPSVTEAQPQQAPAPAVAAAPAAETPAVSPAPEPKPQERPPPLPPLEAKAGPAAEPLNAAAPPEAAASAAADAPYLPRGELSVAPRLLNPVQVPFPETVGGFVDLKVRITLFIDEQGIVRRVRVDTPGVHPAFEQSIRDTFSQARFKPGELQDVAVRSQVRIEVEFSAAAGRRR